MSGKTLHLSYVKLPLISFFIALVGTTLAMWGASWDITSHLLKTPETFFTPSHGVLYSGVGVSLISAIIGLVHLTRNKESVSHRLGLKLIIVGSAMQLIAGPGDFLWHEAFGIDGLMSPTHITLALGILVAVIGALVGFSRVYLNLENKRNLLKIILPITFGVFWFSIMWLIFFFVLPISDGDTHNFNPDPYVGVILGFIALPFAFSVVFWSSYKTLGVFGASSATALSFIMMNVSSNIFTSENLMQYLPWFAAPMTAAIISDYLLCNARFKFSKLISGGVLGSMFFVFCFPMLSMSFLEFYVYNDVFPYDILPTAADTVYEIWILSILPGAVSGMIGMTFASKKLDW